MNITVDRKVIAQALVALERHLPLIEDFGGKEELNRQHEAINALYTALKQQYMTNAAGELEPVTVVQTGVGIGKPEQEPVAHQDTAHKCLLETVPAKGTLFHTAPLQRKPLTDDDIQAIWKKTFESGSSPNTFARAIEHAHNIKE